MQHYHQALSLDTAGLDSVHSDASFLRHFLLFVYDICMPVHDDNSDADMWAIHLNHLQRIATSRDKKFTSHTQAVLIWCICELDMYACLLGSGQCDFLRTIIQLDMLPPLHQQMPVSSLSRTDMHFTPEASSILDVLALNQAYVSCSASALKTEAMDKLWDDKSSTNNFRDHSPSVFRLFLAYILTVYLPVL